jgi:hypothetical protein
MLSFATFHKDQKPMALQQIQEKIQITKLQFFYKKFNFKKKRKGRFIHIRNQRGWFQEVSSSHHHWTSFTKGYGKPSCQMLLQNNNKKKDCKTLKMEPCNPIVHLDGSMSVEVFFNGITFGLVLKKIKMGKPSSYLRFNLVQGRTIGLGAL